jgi:predicted DCC family thiol-disulfide oxidoreductase YuxK
MDLAVTGLNDDQPLLLYDGRCGICAWCVRFVLKHQPHGDIRFAPIDSPLAQRVTPELTRGLDSIVWLSPVPRTLTTESSAVLAVLHHLGGSWRGFGALRLIPRPLRDAVYHLVARHRHRLGGLGVSCVALTADEQKRFLA